MRFRNTIAGLTALTLLLTGTLTAHADDSYGKFVWGEDNWQFTNSSEFFQEYYISDADYAVLCENLSNTELRTAQQFMRDHEGEWLGSCYGMAVTSILACYDMIDYSKYRIWDIITQKGPAVSLYDMTLGHGTLYAAPTEDMQSLITYYFMTQYTDNIRQNVAYSLTRKTDAERLRELEENLSDGSPILLSFFGNLYGGETRSGHAVVAYALEYGEYAVNGRTYTGCVTLYDNSLYENFHEGHYLYFNAEDASWCIPYYELDSLTGATLCKTTDDIGLINSGGMLGDTEYTRMEDFIAILSTNKLTSEHSVSQITFSGDSWTESSEVTAEIQEFPAFLGTSITDGAYNITLSDAESGYVLNNASPEEYNLAMNYENCLLVMDAAAGSQAVFHPSGYTEISGDNTDYTLEMVFNEGYYQGSWYDFTVSGTANTASLQKTEDGYLLRSDNLQNVTAAAGNDETQATLTFSTDADSVLLCEVNESTLAAKIDTDGDGVYETELSAEPETSVYGDFNADGEVNASDAALILQYAAYAGAGGSLSFEAYLAQ